MIFVAFFAVFLTIGTIRISADGFENETITLTYGQTEARKMLLLVNEFRTSNTENWQFNSSGDIVFVNGLEPLIYDYQLEELAMLRAAELSLSFSHIRPNGDRTSIEMYENGYTFCGENIAWGYPTKEAVMEAWKEDGANYNGQAHRRNMQNKNYNVIAIGHAIVNGKHYWVQLFGYRKDTYTNETNANDDKTSVEIRVGKPASISLAESSVSIIVGKTYTINANIEYSEKKPIWKSSDQSVATVDDRGRISARSIGQATITATIIDGSRDTASCVVAVTPVMPRLSAIYNSAKGADIRFKEVEGADSYVIMRKLNGVWSSITTVMTSELTTENGSLRYIDNSVVSNYGQGYIYSVASCTEGICSPYNTAGLPLYRLHPPTIMSVTNKGEGAIDVKWTAENCHGYEIQYSCDNGKNWIKAPRISGGSVTSQTIEDLQVGITYIFRIRCQKTNKDRGTTWSQYSSWKKCVVH